MKTTGSFSVRSPLLVFDRIFRRTGTVRRTCLFHNPLEQELDVEVEYGFPEHSWLQVVPTRGEAKDGVAPGLEGERLRLPPGESRVHVLLDTDSSNFPYDRFLGRVYFRAVDEEQVVGEHWLEVNFEQIEDLSDFEGYAAIDLGTSNSTISLYHLREDAVSGSPWSPQLGASGADVPSAVYIRDFSRFRSFAEGSYQVGQEALRDYHWGPAQDPRSLQLGSKRLVGCSRVLVADRHGSGGYVSPLDLLYAMGRFIRTHAQSHERVNARLKRVMVTFPPTWDHQQVKRWKEVFHRLGYSEDELDLSLDEASAAGLFHIYQWIRDEDSRNRLIQDLLPSWQEIEDKHGKGNRYTLRLLSFDFGGGTTDLAFIESQLTFRSENIQLRIALRGSDSLPTGGDQVTLAVFRILKRKLALALSDPQRWRGQPKPEEEEQVTSDGFFLLPPAGGWGVSALQHAGSEARRRLLDSWETVEGNVSEPELDPELEQAVDAVFPTRFFRTPQEPISIEAKRNFGWLWEQAEMLKRELFREANAREVGVWFSEPSESDIKVGIALGDIPEEIVGRRFRDPEVARMAVGISVDEVYDAIRESLETAVARARDLVGEEGIDRIVLTGQSSWIPLVRRLFMRPRSEGGFGLSPAKIVFDAENAKAAVSKGACVLHVLRDTLVGFEVDVADFKANMLADIFYQNSMGGRRVLFDAGKIDDFGYVEESPDPTSFAEHLSVFSGSRSTLLGQFRFSTGGEPVDPRDELTTCKARVEQEFGTLPSHRELLKLRESNRERYLDFANAPPRLAGALFGGVDGRVRHPRNAAAADLPLLPHPQSQPVRRARPW